LWRGVKESSSKAIKCANCIQSKAFLFLVYFEPGNDQVRNTISPGLIGLLNGAPCWPDLRSGGGRFLRSRHADARLTLSVQNQAINISDSHLALLVARLEPNARVPDGAGRIATRLRS
jgi:hypothetical protein